MSAAVTNLADRAERREESRWLEKLRRLGSVHHAMLIEVNRIASLGDDERAQALGDYRVRLNVMCLVVGELIESSLERAAAKKASGERLEAGDPPEHLSGPLGRVITELGAGESEDL